MTSGVRYSEADQIAIGQAIEYGDGRSDTERKMDRLSQLVAYAGGQVQNLSDEVQKLRKQLDEGLREESRTEADLAQLKEQVDGLKQWVVRLVREKEGIETICAWCGKHISGPVGAAPKRVSHGICPQCLEREFPEKVTA